MPARRSPTRCPVVVERVARSLDDLPVARIKVRPTRAGEAHAITQIAGTEAASSARWNELPVLTSVNPLRTLKPGATLLLSGTDDKRRTQPVLAYQRYGRGKTLALAVQDSWLYQMHASMPLEDMTHENLWRQLLRWVVDAVPESVDVHTSSERVEAGEPVTLTAEVVDKSFVELNDARVVAKVKDPQGNIVDVPMQWTGERSGEYRATFTAASEGMYARGRRGDRARASRSARSSVHMRAAPGDAEYFDATHARRPAQANRRRDRGASSTRRTPSARCRRT